MNKYGWWEEPGIYGEAAAYICGGRVLDLVVTPSAAGDVEADVVEADVLFRGRFKTVRGAKIAAIRAASRIINEATEVVCGSLAGSRIAAQLCDPGMLNHAAGDDR